MKIKTSGHSWFKSSQQYSSVTADIQAPYSQQDQRRIKWITRDLGPFVPSAKSWFGLQSTWWHETFSWTLTAQFLSAFHWTRDTFIPARLIQRGLFNKQQTQTKSSFRLCCNPWYRLSYRLNQSSPVHTAEGLTLQPNGETAFDIDIHSDI